MKLTNVPKLTAALVFGLTIVAPLRDAAAVGRTYFHGSLCNPVVVPLRAPVSSINYDNDGAMNTQADGPLDTGILTIQCGASVPSGTNVQGVTVYYVDQSTTRNILCAAFLYNSGHTLVGSGAASSSGSSSSVLSIAIPGASSSTAVHVTVRCDLPGQVVGSPVSRIVAYDYST